MIEFAELLTSRNDELADRETNSAEISAQRQRLTGHLRRLGPVWAPTLGLWGGVAKLREIAQLVGKDVAAVKSYARAGGLRCRTRTFIRTPAQVAVLAFATLPRPARDVARELGTYAATVVLGRQAITDLLAVLDIGFRELLTGSTDQLETAWRRAGLSLALPRSGVRLHDAVFRNELSALVAKNRVERAARFARVAEIAERRVAARARAEGRSDVHP